jgi:hypothetical protein
MAQTNVIAKLIYCGCLRQQQQGSQTVDNHGIVGCCCTCIVAFLTLLRYHEQCESNEAGLTGVRAPTSETQSV